MQDPFFIDINRGQRFTALASYVAVTAQMSGPPIDEQTGGVVTPPGYTLPYTSGSLAVYATLGASVAPSLAPVIYTQYVDNARGVVAPGAGNYIRTIPPRANVLLPVISSDAVDLLQIGLFDNSGTFINVTAIPGTIKGPMALAITDVNALLTPITLPADCYGILLASSSTRAPNYRLIYQLSV